MFDGNLFFISCSYHVSLFRDRFMSRGIGFSITIDNFFRVIFSPYIYIDCPLCAPYARALKLSLVKKNVIDNFP